jgi:hypothetical protein
MAFDVEVHSDSGDGGRWLLVLVVVFEALGALRKVGPHALTR